MRILVIDDERTFKLEGADYARTIDDATLALTQPWDVVYLDHDLGEQEVSWLTNNIERNAYHGTLLDVGEFVIHSMNPIGRMKMYNALHKFYNVSFARVEDLV